MISISPYVKPFEPKPAVIVQYVDSCKGQELACMTANADLSKYFTLHISTPGTVNTSGTTISGTTASGYYGGGVFSLGYPADIINISYNWMEVIKNQNEILVENLNQPEAPPVMNNSFIDRIELDIA